MKEKCCALIFLGFQLFDDYVMNDDFFEDDDENNM